MNGATKSASWPLTSADGLILSDIECGMLLDYDVLNTDNDMIMTLPPAVTDTIDIVSMVEPYTMYPPSPLELKPLPQVTPIVRDDSLQLQPHVQFKKENLSGWLEEKVDIGLFEQVVQPCDHVSLQLGDVQPQYNQFYNQQLPQVVEQRQSHPPQISAADTNELLKEFDTIFGSVELTHLTPPQSPPGPATQLLLNYAQQAQNLHPAHTIGAEELAVVDELIRHHGTSYVSSSSAGSSPISSPLSSPRSNSSDEEWQQVPRQHRAYARPTDERRKRKKEQNKNAATRYRQKKKAEIEVLLQEENCLRQRNGELSSKCSDVQREIRYLKGLMRDLFKAKGLIK